MKEFGINGFFSFVTLMICLKDDGNYKIDVDEKDKAIINFTIDGYATFSHEYVHYLQTVGTYFGISLLYNCVWRVNILAKALNNISKIDIPLTINPKESIKQFMSEYNEWSATMDLLLDSNNKYRMIDHGDNNKKEFEVYENIFNNNAIPYIAVCSDDGSLNGYPVNFKVISESQAEAVSDIVSGKPRVFSLDDYEYTFIRQLLKRLGFQATPLQVIVISELLLSKPLNAKMLSDVIDIIRFKEDRELLQKVDIENIDEVIVKIRENIVSSPTINILEYVQDVINDTDKVRGTGQPADHVNYLFRNCLMILRKKAEYGWRGIISMIQNHKTIELASYFNMCPVYLYKEDKGVLSFKHSFTMSDDEKYRDACLIWYSHYEILNRLIYGYTNKGMCLLGVVESCKRITKGRYCCESLTKVPLDEQRQMCLMTQVSDAIGIYNKEIGESINP